MITGEEIQDERIVLSELSHRFGARSIGRMAKWRKYKYVTFSGFEDADQLFDIEKDPFERKNRIQDYPEVAERLASYIKEKLKSAETVLDEMDEKKADIDLISKSRQESKEHWVVKEGLAEEPPVPMVSTKVEIVWGRK